MTLTAYEQQIVEEIQNHKCPVPLVCPFHKSARIIEELGELNAKMASALVNLVNLAQYASVDEQVKIIDAAHSVINTYYAKQEMGI